MKVYVLPADVYGCGHYRLIWPANILQQQGVDVVVLPPKSGGGGFSATTTRDASGREVLTSVQIPEDADVVVIQRPAHPLQCQMAQLLRQNGVALVVDMDDDMSSVHPANSAFTMYRPNSATPFSYKWAAETCKVASLVTCTTKALARTYGAHGRVRVLDNYVPGGYLGIRAAPSATFGWAGTINSHPNDLQVTRPAAQTLIDRGYRFAGVGDGKGIRAALGVKAEPSFTGSVKLDMWAPTISETFSVGMIPLAPTSFNTAKSRLKGIEMSAVGVPWVASPRDEYRRLAKESGGGLLADTPKEWVAQLERLLGDVALWEEMSTAGREYMKTQTYETNAWRWVEAWNEALLMERSPGSLSSRLATAQKSLSAASMP